MGFQGRVLGRTPDAVNGETPIRRRRMGVFYEDRGRLMSAVTKAAIASSAASSV